MALVGCAHVDSLALRMNRAWTKFKSRQTVPPISILLTSHDNTAIQVANSSQADAISPEAKPLKCA